MQNIEYLKWLSGDTATSWWHDSADPDELNESLANGAVGATTNPFLVNVSCKKRYDVWGCLISEIPANLKGDERAERIMGTIVTRVASMLEPLYRETNGQHGFVCAQVNPFMAACTGEMIEMAGRFSKWAPNIAVKLPATAAGMKGEYHATELAGARMVFSIHPKIQKMILDASPGMVAYARHEKGPDIIQVQGSPGKGNGSTYLTSVHGTRKGMGGSEGRPSQGQRAREFCSCSPVMIQSRLIRGINYNP